MEDFKNKIDCRRINGSDLAYIGDAYFELWIRLYLMAKGYTKPNDLHTRTQMYVTSTSHAKIIKKIISTFNEKEMDVYHRGRNYNYRHHSKSSKVSDYLMSSGFEAVIGYLYISNEKERLEEIIKQSVEVIEENNE